MAIGCWPTTPDGDPLVIEGPLGKGRIILAVGPGVALELGQRTARRRPRQTAEAGRAAPARQPHLGHHGPGRLRRPTPSRCRPGRRRERDLAAFVADPASAAAAGRSQSASRARRSTRPSACRSRSQPGESRTATFAITWHFPNVQRFQHSGNLYSRRWPDATAVAGYLARNLDALWRADAALSRRRVYQSNLPEEFLDAMASQSVILRGPTCFWSEDGYFGGFEGSYGCCPLNCTHVWNYAQSHARLFPDVGRNMRISNFITFLHPNGETSHREHAVARGLHRRALRVHRGGLPRIPAQPGPPLPGNRSGPA